jgi:hypothetical protein
MPKAMTLEELFKQNRNSSIYFESWENSHNKRDPPITKWITTTKTEWTKWVIVTANQRHVEAIRPPEKRPASR